MATVGSDLESVELTTRELWLDGTPHELFKQMRSGCPIHTSRAARARRSRACSPTTAYSM